MKIVRIIMEVFIIISIFCVLFLANAIAQNYNLFYLLLGQNTSHFFCVTARPYQYKVEPMGPILKKLRRKFCIGYICVDNQWMPISKIYSHN
jgi:hypothetical protein